MGTRSLTIVQDGEGKEIVTMYRQMDGYPSGLGQELVDFLKTLEVCNGLGGKPPKGKQWANGAGCLAAQVVAHFKTQSGAGGVYLYPQGTREVGEEWIYTVQVDEEKKKINFKVSAGSVTFFGMPGTKAEDMPALFSGPLKDFNAKKIEKLYDGMSIEPTALQEK